MLRDSVTIGGERLSITWYVIDFCCGGNDIFTHLGADVSVTCSYWDIFESGKSHIILALVWDTIAT